jgi:hypothetical protein
MRDLARLALSPRILGGELVSKPAFRWREPFGLCRIGGNPERPDEYAATGLSSLDEETGHLLAGHLSQMVEIVPLGVDVAISALKASDQVCRHAMLLN